MLDHMLNRTAKHMLEHRLYRTVKQMLDYKLHIIILTDVGLQSLYNC